MKTIPVEPEGNIYVPLPSRRHHVARVTYKILLAVLTAVALGAAVKSSDPMITPSLVLFTPSLPAFWYVEYKIRQVRSWKQDTRKYRGILFTAEFCIPLALSMAVTSVPSLLQAYGVHPSTNMIALTSLVFLFVVTLGGILANRVWTLSKLGFEH